MARPPVLGDGIKYGKLKLILVGVEVDEQIIDLAKYFLGAGVGAVHLVDDNDEGQAALQGLADDETRLRERALGGVHQEHRAVHHREHALDLAAKVGVARGVHDIEQRVLELDRAVFRHDGDAFFALKVHRVHHPLIHGLAFAEDAALPEQRVHERRFAVIDVGDNGEVANVVADGGGHVLLPVAAR